MYTIWFDFEKKNRNPIQSVVFHKITLSFLIIVECSFLFAILYWMDLNMKHDFECIHMKKKKKNKFCLLEEQYNTNYIQRYTYGLSLDF